jgi:hypothetical protein
MKHEVQEAYILPIEVYHGDVLNTTVPTYTYLPTGFKSMTHHASV